MQKLIVGLTVQRLIALRRAELTYLLMACVLVFAAIIVAIIAHTVAEPVVEDGPPKIWMCSWDTGCTLVCPPCADLN